MKIVNFRKIFRKIQSFRAQQASHFQLEEKASTIRHLRRGVNLYKEVGKQTDDLRQGSAKQVFFFSNRILISFNLIQ